MFKKILGFGLSISFFGFILISITLESILPIAFYFVIIGGASLLFAPLIVEEWNANE